MSISSLPARRYLDGRVGVLLASLVACIIPFLLSAPAASAAKTAVAAQTPIEAIGVGTEASGSPASVGGNRAGNYDGMSGCCVAPSGARGLSPLGGVIEQTGANAAGGRVFTSTGAINQNDFAGIVNSGLTRGDDVHIFTGAHSLADGSLVTDASLLADGVARFGDIPGVHLHDLPSMSSPQVQGILEGPGTIIGGFCDSGACLAGFGG